MWEKMVRAMKNRESKIINMCRPKVTIVSYKLGYKPPSRISHSRILSQFLRIIIDSRIRRISVGLVTNENFARSIDRDLRWAGLSIRKWVGGEPGIVGGDHWAPKARCCLGGPGACSPGKMFKFDTIMKHSEGLCYSDWSLLHAWNLPLLAHSCRRFCLFDLSCIIRKWQVNDNFKHNIMILVQVNPEGGRRCGL